MSTSVQYDPDGESYRCNFVAHNGGYRYYDGYWQRLDLPEQYDTDTYIGPVNVRFSFSYNGLVTARDYTPGYWTVPKFAIDIANGRADNYDYLYTGTYTDSPVINLPVANPSAGFYSIRFRFTIPQDAPVEYYNMTPFKYTVSYDIYYRDTSGGGLPNEWTENTTAPAATLPDDLPTVTTAAPPEDTAEQITGLLDFPSGLLDGMHYLRDNASQFLGLRYVSFIVVLGLICALVAWFLH